MCAFAVFGDCPIPLVVPTFALHAAMVGANFVISASWKSAVWSCADRSLCSCSDGWSYRCGGGVARRKSLPIAHPLALSPGYARGLWRGLLPLFFCVAPLVVKEDNELGLGVVLIWIVGMATTLLLRLRGIVVCFAEVPRRSFSGRPLVRRRRIDILFAIPITRSHALSWCWGWCGPSLFCSFMGISMVVPRVNDSGSFGLKARTRRASVLPLTVIPLSLILYLVALLKVR